MNKNEFIEKVNSKYGVGKYTILGEYKNNKSKILTKCNTCGYEWEVNAGNFINVCKVGCPKCACKKSHDEAKLTTEEIIKRGKKLYGNRYLYDKVDSLNRDEKGRVCFTCNVCGEDFWERPALFLKNDRRIKANCPNCVRKTTEENIKIREEKHKNYLDNYVHDTESFIKKLNKKFPNFYDTSETIYINSNTDVVLIHDGHKIIATPASVLGNKKPILQNKIHNTNSFISKARIIHKDKYKYFHTIYKSAKDKVLITCPIHGDFLQIPNNHLNGNGCPYCRNSKLEFEIKSILDEFSIEYIEKQHFKWLGRQHLDFYLPQYNIAIECQGEQHFNDVVIYDSKKHNIERDTIKYNKCKKNGIKMLYFFPKKTVIKNLLNEEFNHIYSIKNSFKSKEKILTYLNSYTSSSEFKS